MSVFFAVIQTENTSFANQLVGGLTVQDRVKRLLTQAGFHVVDAVAAGTPFLSVRGDAQYGLATFSKIKALLGPVDLGFSSRDGSTLPISWHVSGGLQQRVSLDSPSVFQTGETAQRALEKLAESCLETMFKEIFDATEGWVARGINKRFSFPLTKILLNTSLTPNVLTVLIFMMGLCGAFFVASSSYGLRVVGVSLLQFNSILDGCDGEMARIKGLSSKLGAWMDTVADDILNNALFIALIVGVYREMENSFLLTLGGLTTLASLGVSFFIYRFLLKNNTANAAHFRLSWERSTGHEPQAKSLFDRVKPVLKRDFFILVIWVFVVLNLRPALILLSALPVWSAFLVYTASFIHEKMKAS
jgi:phosphatidylglycerophosphate synthase